MHFEVVVEVLLSREESLFRFFVFFQYSVKARAVRDSWKREPAFKSLVLKLHLQLTIITMKILIVNGFSDSAAGKKSFEMFVAHVKEVCYQLNSGAGL